MELQTIFTFTAEIELIGINPFVFVPENILQKIFTQAQKNKGAIPVSGTVSNNPYKQRLVKYRGEWRLYINTTILKNSPKRIGERISVSIAFDPESREIKPLPALAKALAKNREAKTVFDSLPPSRRLEIIRYVSNLKTEEAKERNIKKAIDFLTGKERFIGRDKP